MSRATVLLMFGAIMIFASDAFAQPGQRGGRNNARGNAQFQGGPPPGQQGQRGQQQGQGFGQQGQGGGGPNIAQMAQMLIQNNDTNGDGALDETELTAALTAMRNRMQQQRANQGGQNGQGQQGFRQNGNGGVQGQRQGPQNRPRRGGNAAGAQIKRTRQ